jgi:hypothetical protein
LPGPFRGHAGGELKKNADQVSAYGQEPWAREALADLRREWPDWAFLVVRYRWLAIRGKEVIVSADGPRELRDALPPVLPERLEPDSTEAAPPPGPGSLGRVERAVPEPGPVRLATLAQLLNGAPGVSWIRASVPPSTMVSASGAGAHAGVAGGGDGAGAGLCGPLTADGSPPGVMAAERSVTGTWAVTGAGGARAAWWQRGWWPWGRGRDRARTGPRAGEDAASARTAGLVEGGRRRHGRTRPRPTAVARPVAA